MSVGVPDKALPSTICYENYSDLKKNFWRAVCLAHLRDVIQRVHFKELAKGGALI